MGLPERRWVRRAVLKEQREEQIINGANPGETLHPFHRPRRGRGRPPATFRRWRPVGPGRSTTCTICTSSSSLLSSLLSSLDSDSDSEGTGRFRSGGAALSDGIDGTMLG